MFPEKTNEYICAASVDSCAAGGEKDKDDEDDDSDDNDITSIFIDTV